MKLHEVDPAVLQGRKLPRPFLDSVFVPNEIMQMLGLDPADDADVGAFWLGVRAGRIPVGVWLPTDPPVPCWDRGVIDDWLQRGCPVPEAVAAHNYIVLNRLVETVRDELPVRPLKPAERN